MTEGNKIVFATFRPHPERADELRTTLDEMVERTRQEPGCEVYDLYRSGLDEVRFHLFERYRDADALGAHRDSEHYRAYRAKVPDLLAAPIEVVVLDALDTAD